MPITRDEVSRDQFARMHEAMLKTTEAAKPFAKLRELKQRIAVGEQKIAVALKAGKATPEDEGYKAAVAKLEALKAEASELTRKHQIPHFALAMVRHFLQASEGWGLPPGSTVSVNLPGIFNVTVDAANEEAPF